MTEVDKLKTWLQENEISITALADAVGMSYDGTYQTLNVRGPILGRLSDGLKWKFAQKFGVDIAGKIFDPDISPTPSIAQDNGSRTHITADAEQQ